MHCCIRPAKRLRATGDFGDVETRGAQTGFDWVRMRIPGRVGGRTRCADSFVPIDAESLRPDDQESRVVRHVTRSHSPTRQEILGAEIRPWPRPADREA